MKPFREVKPIRTCIKKYTDYQKYKPCLAKDFNHRCGYTDCQDVWFGGKDNFHIDHFIPWKNHPEKPYLKTDYSNLVYCCSYVNIAKSNDESPLYLDPCNEDYNVHFQRDDGGTIVPLSKNAEYMYNKMKMWLMRYKIIWMLDQLESRMYKLQQIIKNTQNAEAKDFYIRIAFLYNDYNKYLRQIDE